jgi:hypothetical protein
MIQGSINQLLQLATIAAKLNPNSEKRAAIYQQEQAINQASKLYTDVYKPALADEKSLRGKTEIMGDISNTTGEVVQASEELLKLDPTKEHYNALRENRKMKFEADELVKTGKKLLTGAEQQAQRLTKAARQEAATRKADEALRAEQKRVRSAKRAMKRPGGNN